MTANKQWIFAHAPKRNLATSDFELRENPVPEPMTGEVLVAIKLLSLDPPSRSWMHGRTYRYLRAASPSLGLVDIFPCSQSVVG